MTITLLIYNCQWTGYRESYTKHFLSVDYIFIVVYICLVKEKLHPREVGF